MLPICQEIDFEIKGDDRQFVEIGLDPGQTMVPKQSMLKEISYLTQMVRQS